MRLYASNTRLGRTEGKPLLLGLSYVSGRRNAVGFQSLTRALRARFLLQGRKTNSKPEQVRVDEHEGRGRRAASIRITSDLMRLVDASEVAPPATEPLSDSGPGVRQPELGHIQPLLDVSHGR